jgi:small-conductance mechanosensitive channel
MANDMEFTISARDQASKAVETVKKKLQSFGSDVAKLALGFAAPLALAQSAFSAIGDAIEEHKKKVQEAIDNTAELSDKATDLGVSVEEYQKLSNAADAAGMSLDKVAKAYTEVQKLLAGAVGGGNDTAKMLEVLGFAADDIAKGLVKPMDVIEKLGAAMLGAKDDSTAFKIATAVLGETLAKDLLPQLKAAMDLAAGFSEDSGITQEEAELIRQKKIREKQTKNREEAALAKEEVAKEFLKTDPGAGDVANKFGRELTESGRRLLTRGKINELAGNEEVQNEIMRILKERAAAEKERLRIANEGKANEIIAAAEAAAAEKEAQDAADKAIQESMTQAEKDEKKAREDADKAAEKAKTDADKAKQKAEDDAKKSAEDKEKKDKDDLGKALDAEEKAKASEGSKLTLSSLREIGGGLAGEALVNAADMDRQMLDINTKMLIELQKLNVKTLPEVPTSTDFTKLQTTA